MKKYLAEMIGTMVLVLMGCGTAVSLSCGVDTASVVGPAWAFGRAVVGMAYTIGGISGCHINPAITLGVWMSGRMSAKEAGVYMVAQVIGAIIAAFMCIRVGVRLFFNATAKHSQWSKTQAEILKCSIASEVDKNSSSVEKQRNMLKQLEKHADTCEYLLDKSEREASTDLKKANKEEFSPSELSRVSGADFEFDL